VCLLRQLSDLFRARSGAAVMPLWIGWGTFVHLALMLVEIEFVYAGRSDFESLDISRLAFHALFLSTGAGSV
jgi:hypothetical protein